MIAIDIDKKIVTLFECYPDIQVAILFGSLSTGKVDIHSDLDMGVAAYTPLSVHQKMDIIEALAEEIGRPVDIVDLQVTSGPLLPQILCKGRVIQNKDKTLYARLILKMIYNQEDMMPYYNRILQQRRERFIYG